MLYAGVRELSTPVSLSVVVAHRARPDRKDLKVNRAEQQRRQRELASKRLVKLSRSSRKAELEEAREDMREETQAIREILQAKLAEKLGLDTGATETPQREPETYPSAPAPKRTWNPGNGFRPSKLPRTREGRVSFQELQARSRRAIGQAMRSKQWSDEDRADGASAITLGVLSKALETVETEARKKDRRKRALYPKLSAPNHYGYGSEQKLASDPLRDIPESLATGLALYHRARDYRESREAQLAAEIKLSSGFGKGLFHPETAELETEAPDLERYPIAALRFAWDSCEALGVSPTGDTFSIAYTVARLSSGVDSVPAVATELGMAPERLRSLLKRTHKHFPTLAIWNGWHGEAPEVHRNASYSLPSECERERHYSGTTFYMAYPDRERVAGTMTPTHAAHMERLDILNSARAGSSIARGASDLPEQWRGFDKRGPVYSVNVKRTRVRLSVHRPEWAQALTRRQSEALRAASIARRAKQGLSTESLERLSA